MKKYTLVHLFFETGVFLESSKHAEATYIMTKQLHHLWLGLVIYFNIFLFSFLNIN